MLQASDAVVKASKYAQEATTLEEQTKQTEADIREKAKGMADDASKVCSSVQNRMSSL